MPNLKVATISSKREVSQYEMEHVSIFADPSGLRKMQGQQHHKMKTVEILGFTSAKSLVELTCHIAESMTSLNALHWRPIRVLLGASSLLIKVTSAPHCPFMFSWKLNEGSWPSGVRTYIKPKVPSIVKLHVVETCRRCH